jgi:tetratricopeptide (TPR) repeat protein
MPDLFDRLKDALADRYTIERELGFGGMATVYLAEDLKHHRHVAIKVLKPELAAAVGPERFLREIEISAGLDHPHILPLYDSGEADGFLYYVMPYVEGESLRDRLQRERQLPIEAALEIAREVADALSYAHSREVVHRDIKPENILLAGGHARVADFGIARALSAAGAERLTETGLAIGTPAYMSPEQASGSSEVDGRSDLYSLGCVLYEMLAGEPPFTGATVESIVRQHLAVEPPSITGLRPAVPPQVAAALMRALAKTPADRFSPAAQFADALRPPAVATPPGTTVRHGAPSLWSHPLRAGGVFGLGSLALLALIYLLVVQVGLPTWVFATAVVLLVVGLPMVVATSLLERRRVSDAGTGGTAGLGQWLTWRKTGLGGVFGFSALGLVTVAYMAMRALGIGPAGTLIATGAIAERERILLADFENRTSDSAHGATVTELMRIGLAQSPTVNILDPGQVGRILQRMQRSPAEGLGPDVAMEAAEREGIKGVITGEIVSVGSGFSLSARLVSATGDVLTARQETAASENELVGAVDRLSTRLRERFGESLRSIRRGQPLDAVTTGSLQALRVFSQGLQAWNQGDVARAMQLLEEALTIDTTFAMAYRKLGIILNNQGERRSRAVEAATKAYQYRDRLTERERYLVTAAYHSVVTRNRDQAISAYRTLLDMYPDDLIGLNNVGVLYGALRDDERAKEYYTRALAVDSTNRLYYSNLASTLEQLGHFDSAAIVIEKFEARFPENPYVLISHIIYAAMARDYDAAEQLGDSLMSEQRGTVFWEALALEWMGSLAAMQGRVGTARRRWDRALNVTGGRGLSGQYLFRAARQAVVEMMLLDDPAIGRRLLQEALARYPLESLSPLDRPYTRLALAYAAANEPERAQTLLAEYDATPDADHSIAEERWRYGASWLARAYDQLGHADSATALYEEFAELRSSAIYNDAGHLAHAYMRLGELYEQRGEPEKAIEYYGRFVELWETADAELRPWVERATEAMARLAGEPTTQP